MRLEQQVVSLELAKKMKELGFRRESFFWWFKNYFPENEYCKDGEWELVFGKPIWNYDKTPVLDDQLISAYTIAELGEMFPKYWTYHFQKSEKKENTYFDLVFEGDGTTAHWWGDETEADARAKMLILLKENNLI